MSDSAVNGSSHLPAGMTLIQYGKWTMGDCTYMLKRLDTPPDAGKTAGPATDKITLSKEDSARNARLQKMGMRSKFPFNKSGLFTNKEINKVNDAINQEREQAINDFFDGKLSREELGDKFQELLTRFRDTCNDVGYPIPVLGLSIQHEEAMTEKFYSDFRAKILDMALARNNEEGKQYITGEIDTQRNWKYYNSDYYFKSEDALSAITDGLDQYLAVRGTEIEGFSIELPDYKAEKMDECYNFNSAWSAYFFNVSWRGDTEQFMRDYDQVPPKDFQWFYQSGGNLDHLYFVWVPDGTDPSAQHIPFDEKDFLSATTWASYRDTDGKKHFVSKDFAYDSTENDLKIVSSLLKFTAGDKKEGCRYQQIPGEFAGMSERTLQPVWLAKAV